MTKFIIFAHARSGSTNLTRSLNLHPDLKVVEEPFHERYSTWHPGEKSYINFVKDQFTLEQVLAEIFSRFDGMKVLDYQLPEEIYCHMLQMPQHKVILLQRRNMLQAVVSHLIAEQTGVWHISDLNPEAELRYRHLAPLSLEEIALRLKWQTRLQTYYRQVVLQRPDKERMLLFYEDFYCDDPNKNRAALRSVFRFLGVLMPEIAGSDAFLSPRIAKINNKSRYRLVPNAEQINTRFGNDGVGWLFAKGIGTDDGER